MKIKINGVEVRQDLLEEEVEVKFENLNEEVQKKVFLSDVERFFVNAITSRFETVANLAISNIKKCSKKSINEAVLELNNSGYDMKYMERALKILEIADEEISYETLDVLAFSRYWSIRDWIAWKSRVLPTTIRKMFVEVINKPCEDEEELKHLNHIIKNPSFKFTKELANSLNYQKRD